jgi:transcriptional regulator with XRE-family HTH domain
MLKLVKLTPINNKARRAASLRSFKLVFRYLAQVTHLAGRDKSAYSKIEKGLRALTVDELQKMAQIFNMTTDQVLGYDGKMPKEVVLEDKTAVEQMRLIQQLDDDDCPEGHSQHPGCP